MLYKSVGKNNVIVVVHVLPQYTSNATPEVHDSHVLSLVHYRTQESGGRLREAHTSNTFIHISLQGTQHLIESVVAE